MATLDDATKPIDTSNMTLSEPEKVSGPAPADESPGLNPFFRSPMPQINAYPDTLRQFFHGGIPQTRVIPAPPPNTVGPQGVKGDTGATGASVISSPTVKPTTGQLKREVVSITTAALAAGAVEQGTVALGKTFSVMKIESVSGPCRVRLYSSSSFRTTDLASGRNISTPPTAFVEHGVIADMVFADALITAISGWSGFVQWSTGAAIGGAGYTVAYGPPLGVTPVTGEWVKFLNCPGNVPFNDPVDVTFVNSSGVFISNFVLGLHNDCVGQYAQWPAGAAFVYMNNPAGFDTTQQAILYGGGTPIYSPTNYPVSWVLSPEALGSDVSAFPVGNICYAVDNLGVSTSTVTVNFTILRDEK